MRPLGVFSDFFLVIFSKRVHMKRSQNKDLIGPENTVN